MSGNRLTPLAATAVDSRHEILDAGGDLDSALRDAPMKDAGSSPLTLAWVLKSYDPRPAARALGWSDADTRTLVAFRDWLLERLTAIAAPE